MLERRVEVVNYFNRPYDNSRVALGLAQRLAAATLQDALSQGAEGVCVERSDGKRSSTCFGYLLQDENRILFWREDYHPDGEVPCRRVSLFEGYKELLGINKNEAVSIYEYDPGFLRICMAVSLEKISNSEKLIIQKLNHFSII